MFSLHFIEKSFHCEECSIKEFEELGSSLLLYVEFTSAASRCPYCHHEILDISPKRTTLELIRYFSQFPRAERLKVKFVAMDLSPLFRKVIKTMFPGATIIGVRFHIQRLVIWALERVRKNVQKSFNEKRIYFKRNKHILNKKGGRLTEKALASLRKILKQSPELQRSYALKEAFLRCFL